MKYLPHHYQGFASQHIIDHPEAGLFLDMGLGKTVSTLTAIDQLMNDYFEINRVLVIAPKRVAEDVWTSEAEKWDHLNHLRISVVLGDERQRKEALKAKADIYVINRENVAWLVGYYQLAFPFDMIVIDESSSFKSPKAIRFKALKMVRPKVKRVVLLTGTPAPNGLVDLWSQMYLLDEGKRLGKFVTDYKDRFFSYDPYKRKYTPTDTTKEEIYSKIGDICISMKTEDYIELPERIENIIPVRLSPAEFAKYEEFEKQRVLELEDSNDISVVSAAGLSNKLLQYANGAVYDEEKEFHEVHRAKIEALEERIEAVNGKPVLVAYNYKSDLERIKKYLKGYKPRTLERRSDVADWNAGKIPLLLGHPASMGHGLNLQAGGSNLIWFGNTWNLEHYQQFNKRVHRQGGQGVPVMVDRLCVVGTMDEKVIAAVDAKAEGQDALMFAVKAVVSKYRKVG